MDSNGQRIKNIAISHETGAFTCEWSLLSISYCKCFKRCIFHGDKGKQQMRSWKKADHRKESWQRTQPSEKQGHLLYLQITLDHCSGPLNKNLFEWSWHAQMYFQHIFKGTTWKRPEIQYIKGPSPQRLRAHQDLVSAVSIMECLLCDSEHTGFAESVCDHLSLFDGARALANRRQGQQQVFTLPDCHSLKACSSTQVLFPVLTLIQKPPAKQTNTNLVQGSTDKHCWLLNPLSKYTTVRF